MSINLVTGTPGAGKTLYVVREVVEHLLPQERNIYHNIAGLNIQSPFLHSIDDEGVKKWFEYPEHSVFIFDECQRNFPPRNPMSTVPAWISQFETHRHKGMDFYLITQGPSLIDRHLHPLVENHIHLYRPFGLKRSSVFKWNTVNQSPNPKQSRITSQTRNFSFPKKYFGFYKSASQHTIKARPPWLLLLAVPALVGLLIFAVVYFRHFMFEKMVAAEAREMASGDLEVMPPDDVQDVQSSPPLQVPVVVSPCATVVSVTGRRVRFVVSGQRYVAEGPQAQALLSGEVVNNIKMC